MTRRVFLGLGSNLGDRWSHLQAGVEGLESAGEDHSCSRIYETEPVGGPDGQGPYLNCVVSFVTELSPAELLDRARRVEAAEHRVRAERFGPRTLDVDVLLIDGYVSDDPELTVPHPRMFERAFVLAPLAELDPSIPPVGWQGRFGGESEVRRAARPVGAMLSCGRSVRSGVDST